MAKLVTGMIGKALAKVSQTVLEVQPMTLMVICILLIIMAMQFIIMLTVKTMMMILKSPSPTIVLC